MRMLNAYSNSRVNAMGIAKFTNDCVRICFTNTKRGNANAVSQPNRQVAVFHGRIKNYTASYDLRHADQMTITD